MTAKMTPVILSGISRGLKRGLFGFVDNAEPWGVQSVKVVVRRWSRFSSGGGVGFRRDSVISWADGGHEGGRRWPLNLDRDILTSCF